MWVREALEDLTAAEFASSLSLEVSNGEENGSSSSKRSKRAVDFDNVLAKLDARVEEMCVQMTPEETNRQNATCYLLDRRVMGDEGKTTVEKSCYVLASVGMGSVVYTTEQREALLTRLMATREKLVNCMDGGSATMSNSNSNELDDIEEIRSQLQPTNYSSVEDTSGSISGSKETIMTGFDPSLYVREDGTIDWDGPLQDREALKKFGSAVWSRINGQDPENSSDMDEEGGGSVGDDFSHGKAVTATIVETEAIRQKKEYLDELRKELYAMEMEQTKLLTSGRLAHFSPLIT